MYRIIILLIILFIGCYADYELDQDCYDPGYMSCQENKVVMCSASGSWTVYQDCDYNDQMCFHGSSTKCSGYWDITCCE